jgi:ubiquinone/menaquinone biosynthesis C-methylase UbiE
VGIDVVPELYQYAKQICKRPDWKFLPAPGLTIPMDDNFADFVCFFSVFTHLLHEESYKYLVEAKRVLKPGGKIVFSFLEFAIPYHWAVFESTLGNDDPDKVLNQFMSRDAITAWAEHLDLQIVELADGDKPYIQLNQTIRFENGKEMTGKGNLNQSICVLTKRTP